MAIYTETLNTRLKYQNISVYNQYKDGEQYGYKVKPTEGYVMYDVNDEFYVQNEPDSEPVLTRRYCTTAGFPLNYDFNNFPFVAVPEKSVDKNYIF